MNASATGKPALTRWQASGIHLLISAAVSLAALAVMLLVWYPRPLFEAAGGAGLLFILVGVDVVIGPLITLIIFRAGKRGLRFDLCAIALLQSGALLYGTYIMFEARPVFLVLVKGQFEVVSAIELSPAAFSQARRPEFRRAPLLGPQLAYAELSEQDLQDAIASVISGGPDIHQTPKYFVPYVERRKEALARAQPLEHARGTWPEAKRPIDRFLADSGYRDDDVVYLVGRAPYGWLIALLDSKSGDVVKFILPDPAP
jgi:hypothetical protein